MLGRIKFLNILSKDFDVMSFKFAISTIKFKNKYQMKENKRYNFGNGSDGTMCEIQRRIVLEYANTWFAPCVRNLSFVKLNISNATLFRQKYMISNFTVVMTRQHLVSKSIVLVCSQPRMDGEPLSFTLTNHHQCFA